MKPFKTLSILTILSVFLIVFSCSSNDSEADPNSGSAIEECTTSCGPNFEVNPTTCECECNRTCSAGFILISETCECEEFVPKVIEVDACATTLIGEWKKRTTITDYTGEGYIVWEGPGLTWTGNIGEVGKLTYTIIVEKPGTYLFQWRSYIAKIADVDPWAEHNDSWLKFPDADDFFAKKGGSTLYPSGSGQTPNPAGENGNGFFKVYMNDVDKWSLISSTSDNDAHQIYITFNEAKAYTVEIAARSNFHAIDSFKLIEQP